jgi:hypothetical protein
VRIVILSGPPCAGKTSLADHVARPGDVVVDFDAIARDLGSPLAWMHPDPWRIVAEGETRAAIARAAHAPGDGTAWVIRAAARARQRARLAETWRAPVYLLDPGKAECLRRARDDHRPTGTSRSIGEWYFRYSPWAGDRDPAELHPAWANPTDPTRGVVAVNPNDV